MGMVIRVRLRAVVRGKIAKLTQNLERTSLLCGVVWALVQRPVRHLQVALFRVQVHQLVHRNVTGMAPIIQVVPVPVVVGAGKTIKTVFLIQLAQLKGHLGA